MTALAVALLIALSATAERAGPRPGVALAGLNSRPATAPEMRLVDPCAAAREIVRQRPCLASDDCEALQLWRRSFGAPRIEPLDPSRTAYRMLTGARGLLRQPPAGAWRRLPADVRQRPPTRIQSWPPPTPGPSRRLAPGFPCPAAADPPG